MLGDRPLDRLTGVGEQGSDLVGWAESASCVTLDEVLGGENSFGSEHVVIGSRRLEDDIGQPPSTFAQLDFPEPKKPETQTVHVSFGSLIDSWYSFRTFSNSARM